MKHDKAATVDSLTDSSRKGLTLYEAADRAGVTVSTARYLATNFDIEFARPPHHAMPKDHYRRMGRLSAASPRHHSFTNEERRKASRTRHERA